MTTRLMSQAGIDLAPMTSTTARSSPSSSEGGSALGEMGATSIMKRGVVEITRPLGTTETRTSTSIDLLASAAASPML